MKRHNGAVVHVTIKKNRIVAGREHVSANLDILSALVIVFTGAMGFVGEPVRSKVTGVRSDAPFNCVLR